MKTMIIQYERTAEERERRRMFGDRGARFKAGREAKFAPPPHGMRDDNYVGAEGHKPD